jgi:homoserine O-acetyltransferase
VGDEAEANGHRNSGGRGETGSAEPVTQTFSQDGEDEVTSARTLVHETWGDHAALLARSSGMHPGSAGPVTFGVHDVATPNRPLELELSGRLHQVAVAYETYGELNAKGDNAILICHALTGSAHAAGLHEREEVPGWWDPLIGPGKAIDTNRHFVICSNVLGGCYGSTGPASLDPATGRPYGIDFPRYTVRDMVEAQRRLLGALGVNRLISVIGGSMGGMQVLEWAASHPEMVGSIVPIGIGARHSAWAIGLNEVARRAIMADPAWKRGHYPISEQPETGLGLARAIAMLSYRSFDSLESKFGRERRVSEPENGIIALSKSFEISSYLSYQGVKLVQRFDANTYIHLTLAMDDFDLADSRGPLPDVLARLTMPTLVMGISSDVLYPEAEQRQLVELLPNARFARINSPHGHDAFLIEFPQVAAQLRRFLNELD